MFKSIWGFLFYKIRFNAYFQFVRRDGSMIKNS